MLVRPGLGECVSTKHESSIKKRKVEDLLLGSVKTVSGATQLTRNSTRQLRRGYNNGAHLDKLGELKGAQVLTCGRK